MTSLTPYNNPKNIINEPFKIACIYHGNCWDGIAAAWVVKHFWTQQCEIQVKFFEGTYQQEPDYESLVEFDYIYIVDFSYPPLVLDKLANNSIITLLDHHKSAIEMLKDYSRPAVIMKFSKDNTKSGVGVTWDWFFPYTTMPDVLAYIEDRDLWTWKLEHTKNFTSALQLYPITLESIEYLMSLSEDGLAETIKIGESIEAMKKQQIDMILASAYLVNFEGFQNIPCVNCPPFLISETLNILAKNVPFAIGWYFNGLDNTLKFSLRSDKDTDIAEDVSKLAKIRDGGGHKNAAGFTDPVLQNPNFPI